MQPEFRNETFHLRNSRYMSASPESGAARTTGRDTEDKP